MKITYYTYNQSTKRLTYAPRTLVVGGAFVANPSAAMYADIGAYPLAPSGPAPTPPEGKVAVPDGYELVDGTWARTYRYEDAPPPPPKVYQTADVIEALMAHEVWPQCRAWIEEQGMLDLVLVTKEFADDWPNFMRARKALQKLLDWTDEQVEDLLAEAAGEE